MLRFLMKRMKNTHIFLNLRQKWQCQRRKVKDTTSKLKMAKEKMSNAQHHRCQYQMGQQSDYIILKRTHTTARIHTTHAHYAYTHTHARAYAYVQWVFYLLKHVLLKYVGKGIVFKTI